MQDALLSSDCKTDFKHFSKKNIKINKSLVFYLPLCWQQHNKMTADWEKNIKNLKNRLKEKVLTLSNFAKYCFKNAIGFSGLLTHSWTIQSFKTL